MENVPLQQDNLQALLAEVVNLERQHASSCRARRIAHRLQPLVAFVARYASAVDISLQGFLNPATLIWGLLRSLLVVAQSYTQYFDGVVLTLEELGFVVSAYSQYEDLLGQDCTFRQCLSLVYRDVIRFLIQSKKIFQRSGILVLFQSIWQSFETEFREVLASLSLHTSALRDQVTVAYRNGLYKLVQSQTSRTLEAINELTIRPASNQYENILRWLAPVPVHRRLAQEEAKKVLPSGQWLFMTSEFNSWRNISDERLLWINAPPGTGKTILSTSIIRELSSTLASSDNLCYFFCDKSHPLNCVLHKVLRTLLHQILETSDVITPSVATVHSRAARSGYKELSQAENPLELLQQVVSSFGHVFIVLDGLDESPQAQELTRSFSELVQSTKNCSVLLLSRDVSTIRRNLSCAYSELRMTEAHTKRDLNAFITLAARRLVMSRSDPELETHIRRKLQMNCNGTFRWVYHMAHSLESALRPDEMHCALSQLPVTLKDAYMGDLQRLLANDRQQRVIFTHAVRWLLCSLRPLSIVDLRTALAIDITRRKFSIARMPFLDGLQDLLSPFFELGSEDKIIKPIHPSVTDFFLESASIVNRDNAVSQFCVDTKRDHRLLGRECLLLLTHTFKFHPDIESAKYKTLTEYACFSWPEHMVRSIQDDMSQHDVHCFLDSNYRQEWISRFLGWRKSVFPLQRLFYLQSCMQTWLNPKSSQMYTYLDWAPDVSAMLLEGFQRRPFSDPQRQTGQQFNTTRGAEVWSHFERMMVVRDLSRHLTSTKRVRMGVDMFERALHKGQQTKNVSSSETTWLLNALGILYDQLGQVDHATHTQERALVLLSEHDPPDISRVNWTRNELGRMYRHQGRLEDAARMHNEALNVLERITKDRTVDLEIAWTLSTVARVYRKQRRFEEAILHTQQALEIRRPLQGEDHPHCLWLVSDIAQCYHERGDIPTAVQHHRDVYDGRRRSLGSQHPDTLWTMNNLASTLAKMGPVRRGEALRLQRSAWKSQCVVLGAEHPHTKWTAAMIDALAVGGNVGGIMFDC